jgi:hypothetical protein
MSQQTFMSATWGLTQFFPTGTDRWTDNCRHCLLYRSEECHKAPCTDVEREDGQRGYYSIQQMPERSGQ